MEKELINALLRVYHAAEERRPVSQTLKIFSEEYNVGRQQGKSLYFNQRDKEEIVRLLAQEGIDANTTTDKSWHGLTRAQSTELGNNEKNSSEPVRLRRVAIKTFNGQPLLWKEASPVYLPACSHVEVDYAIADTLLAHDTMIVVENWEAFNQVDDLNLDFSVAGDNPLIVWRGEKSGCRTDSSLQLLTRLKKAVWACVDYDPSGLIIAQSLPNLVGIIRPLDDILLALLEQQGLHHRYQQQIPTCQHALDNASHADVIHLWSLIRRCGKALPQEVFIR
jgi:hypothetical protein